MKKDVVATLRFEQARNVSLMTELSPRIREGFFTDFAEKVQAMKSPVPIQLSGGFRSRSGMADALEYHT